MLKLIDFFTTVNYLQHDTSFCLLQTWDRRELNSFFLKTRFVTFFHLAFEKLQFIKSISHLKSIQHHTIQFQAEEVIIRFSIQSHMSSFFMVKIPPLAEQTVAHVEQASVVELAGKMDNDIIYNVDHVSVKSWMMGWDKLTWNVLN